LHALRPQILKATGFSLATGLMLLAPTGYMLEVYDRVVNSRDHTTLWMLTILVLGAFVVMELLDWARTEVMAEAGRELDGKLSARVFDAIFRANLKRLPGGTAQPMNDFRTLREFLQSPVVLAVMESPVALVFLVLVFAISPVLGWSALLGAVVQTGLAWLNERSTQPPMSEANRAAIGAQQYAGTSLRNAQVIEAMGMLRDIHKRWMELQREFLKQQAVASESAAVFQASTKLVQQIMGSLLAWAGRLADPAQCPLGGGRHDDRGLGAGRAYPGAAGADRVAVARGGRRARRVGAARPAPRPRFPRHPVAMPLPPPRGTIAVETLVAGAPGNPQPIIRGVQFTLQPGEVLAVIGPSASGKTTLARLLVGVWGAMNGKVRLDGVDVFSWNKEELGPHVGYLPQGVELLEGTLAENIARFGDGSPSKVEAAARAVGMHEYISGLPQGYDTPVGREGAILSGGQRQRVALARALYGEPVFVVLDEPNSSLDEAGDAALAEAPFQSARPRARPSWS
jgi:ATP-binding cassette subfamily C exporter for protease/lipase